MPVVIAPGGPGSRPTWTSSAKDIVTTALGTSRVWVTLGYGILNELAGRCCHRLLDYHSRHVAHPALIRAARLRRKLGAAPGLLSPLPPRPRRWRRDYYARLIAEPPLCRYRWHRNAPQRGHNQ